MLLPLTMAGNRGEKNKEDCEISLPHVHQCTPATVRHHARRSDPLRPDGEVFTNWREVATRNNMYQYR